MDQKKKNEWKLSAFYLSLKIYLFNELVTLHNEIQSVFLFIYLIFRAFSHLSRWKGLIYWYFVSISAQLKTILSMSVCFCGRIVTIWNDLQNQIRHKRRKIVNLVLLVLIMIQPNTVSSKMIHIHIIYQ